MFKQYLETVWFYILKLKAFYCYTSVSIVHGLSDLDLEILSLLTKKKVLAAAGIDPRISRTDSGRFATELSMLLMKPKLKTCK